MKSYKHLSTVNDLIHLLIRLRDEDELGDYPLIFYTEGSDKPYRFHAIDNLNKNNDKSAEILLDGFPQRSEVKDKVVFDILPQSSKKEIKKYKDIQE